MTVEELLALAHSQEVEFVDLRYTIFPGRWQHHTVTLSEMERRQEAGSSRLLWTLPEQPECTLLPDLQTAVLDPFCQHPTLAVICDVLETRTGQPHPADVRSIAQRTAAALQAEAQGGAATVGAVVECYVFDQVSYDQSSHAAAYRIDCREGVWRRGRDEPENLGLQLPPGAAQGCLPPGDTLHNLRGEMIAALLAGGVPAVGHYHAAGAGQIGFELSAAPLLTAADQLMHAKYIMRNAAARQGKVVTFMAKPVAGDAASRLLLRLSLSQGGVPLLVGDRTAGLSEAGRYAAGGVLAHVASLLAVLCPTINGYRALSAGTDRPRLTIAARDGGCLEIAPADPTCQPYLAYSAVALAALDGIVRRLDPGPLVDTPTPHPAPSGPLPETLEGAIHALREDHQFLLRGAAWTEELIQRFIEYKLDEIGLLRQYPHPGEFSLYFDG